jgi:heme-degrading monooxygenase HmoA
MSAAPATPRARATPEADPATAEYVAAVLAELREHVRRIIAGELARVEGRLRGRGILDPRLSISLTATVNETVTALLDPVAGRLTRLAAGPGGRWYADALRDLFALDVPAPAPHGKPRRTRTCHHQHRVAATERGGTMFTVVTEFTVPPDHRDSFEQSFTASMQATLAGVPGLHRAQLLRPDGSEDDASGYVASFDFDDEAAYAAYTSSEAFRAAHRQDREPLAAARRVTTYETVTQIPA